MGLQIGDIVPRTDISFEKLKGKKIAIDAFNALYQFLASIRQPDGTPLMDEKGRVTSHLSGVFYRNITLLSEGIKPIYVFDGTYHSLKSLTHEIRNSSKAKLIQKYQKAKEEDDIEAMGKYATGFSRLNEEMIEESKELLEAMGISVVQAPSEGEMQCAQLVKDGEAYAVASQDYDALVVGASRLIQNLTLSRKRKTRTGFIYISPEIIEYEKVLNHLGIDGDGLITLAILVGTDFNPKGVPGIGPKKALALVQKFKYPSLVFSHIEGKLNFDWKEIFEIFKKPNVKKIHPQFPKINEEKIKKILVDKHDFNPERVSKQLEKLHKAKEASKQRTLF